MRREELSENQEKKKKKTQTMKHRPVGTQIFRFSYIDVKINEQSTFENVNNQKEF